MNKRISHALSPSAWPSILELPYPTMCPFTKAEKRLNDCAEFWKQAEASYQEPAAFVRYAQATIHGLRSVTFVLQASKRQIPSFEAWYAGWQDKMRQDRVLCWLVDTRNKIEKVGDIEPASKLHLTFCEGWLADKENEVDVPASYTAHDAAGFFAALIGPSSKAEDALIRFRREWRHPELLDRELLDALVYCYGILQELLLHGHHCLEDSIAQNCTFHQGLVRTNEHLPMYMQDRSSSGSAWYRLKDRSIMSLGLRAERLDKKTVSEITKTRFGGFNFESLPKRDGKDLLGRCNDLMSLGQHLLKTNGGLMMNFFIEGEGLWIPIGFQPRDRAEKHAFVREVADHVVAHRAELVMCISEMWVAPTDPNKPGVHAVDHPNRNEGIGVNCLSRTGKSLTLLCEFTRTDSGIEFGEVQKWETMRNNWLEPIQRAFTKINKN